MPGSEHYGALRGVGPSQRGVRFSKLAMRASAESLFVRDGELLKRGRQSGLGRRREEEEGGAHHSVAFSVCERCGKGEWGLGESSERQTYPLPACPGPFPRDSRRRRSPFSYAQFREPCFHFGLDTKGSDHLDCEMAPPPFGSTRAVPRCRVFPTFWPCPLQAKREICQSRLFAAP